MTPIRTLRPLAKVVLSTQSDERLVALSRAGSEDAFAEIVRRHRPGLLRLARSLGTGDRADDVVQEGLVRAWRALQRTDAEIELRPWLTTIVRNRALTSHSANRPTEELDETIDGVRQPGDIVIMREELRSAVSAVNSLPESQREALVRSALSGESHDQIASALATTPGAVRQLIFRARLGLREALGALVPFPLVRMLADASASASAGGAAVGGSAAGGAAIAASAGGASVGLKALALVAIGATVAGSGIAFERHTSGADAKQATTTAVEAGSPAGDEGSASGPRELAANESDTPSTGTSPGDGAAATQAKSQDAAHSRTLLIAGSDGSGSPRVSSAAGGSTDSHQGGSAPPSGDPAGQPTPQQTQQQHPPHQADTTQPPPPPSGQTDPSHQGGGEHQSSPPPPPPSPGGETATGDGGGYHQGTYDGRQPQPTDGHDDYPVGSGGLVDLTLGD
jgi:RNA polymerase sigma factor (sigma-70 family)